MPATPRIHPGRRSGSLAAFRLAADPLHPKNPPRFDARQQRMMQIRHKPRRVLGPALRAAAWPVAIAIALVASPARATTPEESIDAFRELDAWVRAWSIPDDAPVDLGSDASGVSVTLRLGGRVVGRGVAMRGDSEALADAARRAWVEANQRMPVERDALRSERLREMAQALTIDLEIAGPLTPLFGDTLQAAGASVSPGREGVAARAGERTSAVFPDLALTASMPPTGALRAALGDLQMPLAALTSLRDQHGVIIYRFETTHLGQLDPDSPPMFLTRGGRLRTLADVSPAGLRDLGDRVTTHLLLRRWPGEEPFGFIGTYLPARGAFADPAAPTPRAQAMAALALACWADARQSERAREGAILALRDLANVHESEQAPATDPVGAAVAMMTLAELGAIEAPGFDLDAFRDLMRETLRAAYTGDAGFAGGLRPPEQAVVAAGLTTDAELRPLARDAVRRLFRETAPPTLPALMPWLGWAELSLAEPGERIPSEIALLDFRSLVWRHQLTAAGLDPRDADLAGGVVFTAGGAALPTDQTLRPLAFLATMLGEPSLTTRDRLPGEFGRLMRSLRFLAQLTAGEAAARMYPDADRAIGGVRAALWDQRMPLESSAMGLLTLAETLRSLEKRTGGPADANGEGTPR